MITTDTVCESLTAAIMALPLDDRLAVAANALLRSEADATLAAQRLIQLAATVCAVLGDDDKAGMASWLRETANNLEATLQARDGDTVN